MRWDEEITLLTEEMRRTTVFLNWQAQWWKERSEWRKVSDVGLQEGIKAYANRQAALRQALASQFTYLWRFSEYWKQSKVVPDNRQWFEDLDPKAGPPNRFAGIYI